MAWFPREAAQFCSNGQSNPILHYWPPRRKVNLDPPQMERKPLHLQCLLIHRYMRKSWISEFRRISAIYFAPSKSNELCKSQQMPVKNPTSSKTETPQRLLIEKHKCANHLSTFVWSRILAIWETFVKVHEQKLKVLVLTHLIWRNCNPKFKLYFVQLISAARAKVEVLQQSLDWRLAGTRKGCG